MKFKIILSFIFGVIFFFATYLYLDQNFIDIINQDVMQSTNKDSIKNLKDINYKYYNQSYEDNYVKSDLVIPAQHALLKRPHIINKLKKKLNKNEGMENIAMAVIIGSGGSGKTILARYFARLSGDEVVWEINSESKKTLVESFTHLAYELATASDSIDELNMIEHIVDKDIKDKKILNFVRKKLKQKKSWILIYDNLEKFDEIKSNNIHFFPQNSGSWGNGKVIITTRNEYIAETSYTNPENVIFIDILSSNEKLTLFTKIVYNNTPDNIPESKRKEILKFLKKIPPFPIDICLAAYYIKNNNVSFKDYLKLISINSAKYEKKAEETIREVIPYNKTRYGIISSTIKNLSKHNSRFKELFFFLCLLDAENIPIHLIEKYNNSIVDFEEFIYDLRRSSLMLKEDKKEHPLTISIHQSTQEMGFSYYKNTFKQSEKINITNKMILALSNYCEELFANKDKKTLNILIPHIASILDRINQIDIPSDKKKILKDHVKLLQSKIQNFTDDIDIDN